MHRNFPCNFIQSLQYFFKRIPTSSWEIHAGIQTSPFLVRRVSSLRRICKCSYGHSVFPCFFSRDFLTFFVRMIEIVALCSCDRLWFGWKYMIFPAIIEIFFSFLFLVALIVWLCAITALVFLFGDCVLVRFLEFFTWIYHQICEIVGLYPSSLKILCVLFSLILWICECGCYYYLLLFYFDDCWIWWCFFDQLPLLVGFLHKICKIWGKLAWDGYKLGFGALTLWEGCVICVKFTRVSCMRPSRMRFFFS